MNNTCRVFGTGIASLLLATSSLADVCAPVPSGTQNWWPLEGGPTEVVSGQPSTFLGGAWVSGKVGQALDFNTFGDGVKAPNVSLPTEFTIDAWIFPMGPSFFGTSHPGPGPIAEFFDAVSFFQHPSDGDLHLALRDTGGPITTYTASGGITPNAWNHAAVTYSSSTGIAKFYANGVQTGSYNFGTITLPSSADFYIGNRAVGSYGQDGVTYNGVIDEVHLFSRVLAASEIQAINAAGSAGLCQNAPQQLANLLSVVEQFNLSQGITNSLDSKVQNALDAINAARGGSTTSACNLMSAFINNVNGQTGKQLTAAQGAVLIASANQIRATLGCP